MCRGLVTVDLVDNICNAVTTSESDSCDCTTEGSKISSPETKLDSGRSNIPGPSF
jgi:hypothetical protein